jgi:hypothetical protein
MYGMGRFAAVVLPVYIVLGRLLYRLPPPVAAALLAVSAFFFSGRSMRRCATLSATESFRRGVCASWSKDINQFPLKAR